MKRNRWLRLAAISMGCLTMAAVQAGGDTAAGRIKAETCMGCHGVESYKNVYPTYNVPKLGGQYGAYIVSALKAYRAGDRNHGTMHANASALSDQDMEDVAAYISSQPCQ